jgi:hypothetical protein
MKSRFDPRERAAEKQRSRDRDESALRSADSPLQSAQIRERLRVQNGGNARRYAANARILGRCSISARA